MDADLRAASGLLRVLGVSGPRPEVAVHLEPTDMEKYPGKLYHAVPGWVSPGAVFHVRIRVKREVRETLISPAIGSCIIESALHFSALDKWYVHLFMIMPDHIHALLSFPQDPGMARTVGEWKRFHNVKNGVQWQDNFFDHRIRNQDEFATKAAYIRNNPVAKGLCKQGDDWIWMLDHRARDAVK